MVKYIALIWYLCFKQDEYEAPQPPFEHPKFTDYQKENNFQFGEVARAKHFYLEVRSYK